MSARDEVDPLGLYRPELDANEILSLETAVINTSMVYREAAVRLARYSSRNDEDGREWSRVYDAHAAAEAVWDNAVDMILAARAKREEGE